MSVSYIPQEIYAVCTNQMSATPQKLIASRDKITVFHDGKPLLTKKDKNLEVQFSCKSPINTFATFLAFGIGLALALAVPIGFVVAGAIIGLIVSSIIIKNHQCTSPMKIGSWILPHSNVKFNGYEAITQMSMLSCNNGGVLKPFFSYSLACKASVEIRNNNYTEIGINVVVSFFLGLLLPKALTKAFKTESGILNFLGTNLIGIGVTWGIQYAQKEYMRRDEELSDNIVYQNMNEIEDETNVDDPSDLNDIASLESFKDAVKQGKITSNNAYAQGQLNKFSNYTTNQLKNSAEFKNFLNEIDKNTYGEKLRESMLNKVRKLFGPNKLKPTSEAVKKGIAQNQIDIKRSFYGMLKKGGEGSLFFLPFVSTYFSENMRKYFAKEAFKDMNNGINVVAQNPL
jgi:hypothetical protein